MKALLLALAICISTALSAQVYTRNYEVKSSDKRVGEVTAVKHADGDLEQYDISSDVYMTLLFKIHVSYKVQANFKDGILVSSSATVYLNERIQDEVDVMRTGDHYTVTTNGHKTRIYGDIEYSSAKLYFSRPDEVKKVFSETNGELKDLVKTSDGNFRLKNPEKESEVNTYKYSSDQGLHSVLIERSMFPDIKLVHVREPGEIETREKEEE
ncbi:MAG: DUF6134 family protein [Cryomorphaceae bacterium]|nr:hypothetical protein [Flavobacteriales bacterium]